MDTTTEATTQAIQEKIMLKPKCSVKNIPIDPFLPNMTSSMYPITDGGKTIGKTKNASKKSFKAKLHLTKK